MSKRGELTRILQKKASESQRVKKRKKIPSQDLLRKQTENFIRETFLYFFFLINYKPTDLKQKILFSTICFLFYVTDDDGLAQGQWSLNIVLFFSFFFH